MFRPAPPSSANGLPFHCNAVAPPSLGGVTSGYRNSTDVQQTRGGATRNLHSIAQCIEREIMLNAKWMNAADSEPARLAQAARTDAPRGAFAQRDPAGRRFAANLAYAVFFVALVGMMLLEFPKI